jgi:hypothetical protein
MGMDYTTLEVFLISENIQTEPGMVAYVCNPSTQEVDTGRSQV